MFIITAENHAAQFVLRGGEIVGLTYRVLRGLDALPPMQTFTAGRYRFVEEPVDRIDPGLPPTSDLMALLIQEHAGEAEPPQAKLAAEAMPFPDPLRSLIELELAEFLGPMAGLICQEHLAHSADPDSPKDLPRLVEAIAKEIGDPSKEAQFKQRVLSKIKAP